MVNLFLHCGKAACVLLICSVLGCGSDAVTEAPHEKPANVGRVATPKLGTSAPDSKSDKDASETPETVPATPLIDPSEIQSHLRQGGSTWSASDEIVITDGRYELIETSSRQIWLWPDNDDFITLSNRSIRVTLNWSLRPGQSLEEGVVIVYPTLQSPERVGASVMGTAGYETGMLKGTFESSFDISQFGDPTEVIICLVKAGRELGSSTPASNLLKIKVPAK